MNGYKLNALPSILILLAASLAATAAQAIEPGWYVGGSVGQTDVKDDDCPDGASCDDDDIAWKAFGGYQFNQYWGLEVGYLDLGEYDAKGPGTDATFEADGFSYMATAGYPITDKFSILTRFGGYRWDADLDSSIGSGSNSGNDFAYGFGARYDFSDRLAARIEWEKYLNVGDSDKTGESDFDLLSGSLMYKF